MQDVKITEVLDGGSVFGAETFSYSWEEAPEIIAKLPAGSWRIQWGNDSEGVLRVPSKRERDRR